MWTIRTPRTGRINQGLSRNSRPRKGSMSYLVTSQLFRWYWRYASPTLLDPLMRDAKDHNYNRLDQTMFPFVKDIPPELTSSQRPGVSAAPPPSASSSLRSARPTWHKAPAARVGNTEGTQRLILFIAGGMTYSEMRLAYTIGQALGKEVFIGQPLF